MTTQNIDLKKYTEFVAAVTSEASNDLTTYMNRLDVIDGNYDFEKNQHGPHVNVPLLITGAMGLCSETGEFMEIVKKIFFQGKPLDEATKTHMIKELGDVIWYWANACRALDVDPNDVVSINVEKLQSRYPGGKFSVHYSENRQAGDI